MKSSIAELGLISSWVQMIYQRDTGWEFDDGTDSGDYTGSGDGQFFVFGLQKCHQRRRKPHTQAATIFLLGLVNVTRVPCDGVVQVGLTMGMWHVSVLTYSKKSPHTGETS